MEREYTIVRVDARDEWGPNHGHMMKDYAISLEGEQGWIKLTQRVETEPPREGTTIFGVIENKTSSNGNSYKKFRKVNPEYQGNRSAYGSGGGGQQSSSELAQRVEYAVQMLEELTGRRDVVHGVPTEDDDPFAGLGV